MYIMRPQNLLSVYQGAEALENFDIPAEKKIKRLKRHEIRNLRSFCNEMLNAGCHLPDLDGFFVGYTIQQIGKEFDLLRFGENFILNIELKSELKIANKADKIEKQLKTNHYYLKFLGKPLRLFSYVENDGYYEYVDNSLIKTNAEAIATCMHNQVINYTINPDHAFVPSSYLVSPFNSTDKFMGDEYFLTTAQQRIKDEIHSALKNHEFAYFSISANAGTGKTLLTYDMAKELRREGYKVLIIHCGILNEGHLKLKQDYSWNIVPIRDIGELSVQSIFADVSVILIDESQRIRGKQLQLIIDESKEHKIPIIFSYDVKQYLKRTEGRDIEEYIRTNYPEIPVHSQKLTTKIRTNKEMASFITNLLNIGSSKDHLNYDCVSIEYLETMQNLQEYMEFLKNSGWTTLTYTTSQYNPDPYDELAGLCEKNAHAVIGQEFPKVAFVMDQNFRYKENKLTAKVGYYSPQGMLYQIVTRAVDELKIVVFNNPELYLKLTEIKMLSMQS